MQTNKENMLKQLKAKKKNLEHQRDKKKIQQQEDELTLNKPAGHKTTFLEKYKELCPNA